MATVIKNPKRDSRTYDPYMICKFCISAKCNFKDHPDLSVLTCPTGKLIPFTQKAITFRISDCYTSPDILELHQLGQWVWFLFANQRDAMEEERKNELW